jgi:hypothetical protein
MVVGTNCPVKKVAQFADNLPASGLHLLQNGLDLGHLTSPVFWQDEYAGISSHPLEFLAGAKNSSLCEKRSNNAQNASKNEEVILDSLRFSHLPSSLTRFDFHT